MSFAAMGQWIRETAAEALARMQLTTPALSDSTPPGAKLPGRSGEPGKGPSPSRRSPRNGALASSGGPPFVAVVCTPAPSRRSTSALAEAMRQRGGVQRASLSGTAEAPQLDPDGAAAHEDSGGPAEPGAGGGTDKASAVVAEGQGAVRRPEGARQPHRRGGTPSRGRRGPSQRRAPAQAVAESQSPTKGSLIGEIRDFLHRGAAAGSGAAPRSPPVGRSPGSGGRREPGSRREAQPQHAAVQHLQQRFSEWASATGHLPEQVRLSSVQLLRHRAQDADEDRGAALMQAAVVVDGVEVLVTVSASGPFDVVSRGIGMVSMTAMGAETRCRWDAAEQRVLSAARFAAGRPLEEMLGALCRAFRGEAEAAHLGALTPTPPRHAASTPPGTETPSSGASSGCRAEGECDEGSFAAWLEERPPLLRFDRASRGMAWDFPLAKAEKHELLLLQLFAQEAGRRAEMEAVRRRASVAPSFLASTR